MNVSPNVIGRIIQGIVLGILLTFALIELYLSGSGSVVFRYQGF